MERKTSEPIPKKYCSIKRKRTYSMSPVDLVQPDNTDNIINLKLLIKI